MDFRSTVLSLVLLAAPFTAYASDALNKQQVDRLFTNAAGTNLRSKDSRPFHLRIEIHVSHISSKPLDGTYEETWQSPEAWRRQIAFPGFTQQEVGDGEGRWLARTLDFRPHSVYLLS